MHTLASQMLLFQVIVVVSLFSLVSADCDAEAIQSVKVCYVPYLAGFNLTLVNNRLPEYWTFHNARVRWVSQDGKALIPICELFHTLYDCLKPFTCLGYRDFENSLGPIEANNSKLYWQDISVSNYQCGAGFNIMVSDGYCIGAARQRHGKELNQCVTDFSVNIGKKGYCKAEQSLLNCQTDIFQKSSDWNSGVFMCNCILAGFNSMDSTCYDTQQVSCPNPRFSDNSSNPRQPRNIRDSFRIKK